MNHDYEIIKSDMATLGIKQGDDILLHSSFRSLGGVEGGIQTLIEALLASVGDRGTLLFPCLSWKSVNEENGYTFDVLNTPCCVGAIPEFFRHYDGVERSVHPTHSVCALGKRMHEYLDDHILDDGPVGENSPFYKLSQFGGKVIFLGCRTRPNTSMHGVEERFGVTYLMGEGTKEYTLIDKNGKIIKKDYRYHNIWHNGYDQRYDKLEDVMEFTKGVVHGANCNVVDSAAMWKNATEKLKEDEFYFVEERTDEEWIKR